MNRQMIWVGVGLLILIAITTAGVILFGKPADFRGTTYEDPYPVAREIELLRSDGSTFHLSDLRGETVLLFFGYTSCPDVCPTTLAELNQAMNQLGPTKAKQVKVLFVTVDPDRDTPERIQQYLSNFNPSFIGLGGSLAQLSNVWQSYGVFREVVESGSSSGALINHTARVTLIDKNGNMRTSYSFDAPVEDIVHDINLLLK